MQACLHSLHCFAAAAELSADCVLVCSCLPQCTSATAAFLATKTNKMSAVIQAALKREQRKKRQTEQKSRDDYAAQQKQEVEGANDEKREKYAGELGGDREGAAGAVRKKSAHTSQKALLEHWKAKEEGITKRALHRRDSVEGGIFPTAKLPPLVLEDTLKKKGKCTIMPNSNFRSFWDLGVVMLVLYNAFSLPWVVCFSIEESDLKKSFDNFVDVIFAMDIALNFFTAIEHGDSARTVTYNHKTIAWAYAKGWLVLDVLGVFPFDLLIPAGSSTVATVLPILKCFRLFRLSRLFKFLDKFHFFGHMMRMMRLLLFFILIAHWYACIFYLVGSSQGDEGWLSLNNLPIVDDPANNITATHKDTLYITSLYWTIVTFLTIGYGDIAFGSTADRIFAMGTMVTGALVYATIFGSVHAMLLGVDKSKEFNAKIKVQTAQTTHLLFGYLFCFLALPGDYSVFA